jgi:hypothetical protein
MVKKEFQHSMAILTSDLRKQTEECFGVLEKGGIKVLPVPGESDLNDFHKVHDQVAQGLEGKIYPKEFLNRVYGILKRPHS